MARTIKGKVAGLAAGVMALTVATGTAVQAQDTVIEGVATSEVTAIAAADIATQLDALTAAEAVIAEAAEAEAPAEEATAVETTPATAAEAPAAEAIEEAAPAAEEAAPAEEAAATPYVIDVNCSGTQAEIDTCVGATNYTPVADYLGVPYYAQHNGMGGEAWLSFNIGDQVVAGGVTYTIVEIRQVVTGGDIDQIAGMGADAYLQTCLTDGVHSKVFALMAA